MSISPVVQPASQAQPEKVMTSQVAKTLPPYGDSKRNIRLLHGRSLSRRVVPSTGLYKVPRSSESPLD